MSMSRTLGTIRARYRIPLPLAVVEDVVPVVAMTAGGKVDEGDDCAASV